jgi:hypothetical protein
MSVLESRGVSDYSFSLIYSEYNSKTLEVAITADSEVKRERGGRGGRGGRAGRGGRGGRKRGEEIDSEKITFNLI